MWDNCYESGDDVVGTAEDLEHGIGWTGEPGLLTRALAEAGCPIGVGFIEPITSAVAGEPVYRVHDLWHHAPDYVANRRTREQERRLPKVCERCGGDYFSADPRSKYCSPACKQGGWRDKRYGPLPKSDVTVTDRYGSLAPSTSTHTQHPAPNEDPAAHTPTAQELVTLWNQSVTSPIPQVTKLTADRRAKLNARLKEVPDLAIWRTVIAWINRQEWCRASGAGDHPNWTASLDWLCKSEGQVQRYIEKSHATNQPRERRSNWECAHTPKCPEGTTPRQCQHRTTFGEQRWAELYPELAAKLPGAA